jgi:hypothetical protein
MYGLTRAGTTLIGAAIAGFLFWVGTRIVDHPFSFQGTSKGDYWLWVLTLAAAGFVMALSQLLGGWTKWGWPTISIPVLIIGFVPPLIVGLWILAFHQPGRGWGAGHVRSWSDDIGVFHTVSALWIAVPAIAFLLGLLFGFSFDTSGPGVARAAVVEEAAEPAPVVPAGPAVAGEGYADQVVVDRPANELDSVATPVDNGDRETVVTEPVDETNVTAPDDRVRS